MLRGQGVLKRPCLHWSGRLLLDEPVLVVEYPSVVLTTGLAIPSFFSCMIRNSKTFTVSVLILFFSTKPKNTDFKNRPAAETTRYLGAEYA